MARSRLLLQSLFEDLLGGDTDPSKKVMTYFQPGENTTLEYPCIIYEPDGADVKHADNLPYFLTKKYKVTLITRNADEPLTDLVALLPMTTYDRWFAADQLHHHVFTTYF